MEYVQFTGRKEDFVLWKYELKLTEYILLFQWF